MHSRTVRRALVALALIAAVTGCTDDEDDSAIGTASETPAVVEPTPPTTEPGPRWVRHEGGEDCECADGSEFAYFSRTDDPEKVLLYFQGGGACFSAETCDPETGTYKPTVVPGDDPAGAVNHPDGAPGIFAVNDPANPFADWSMVFVPYCTGDLHLGDATTAYGDSLTIEHNGYTNARQGLDHLVEHFPDATDVFVAGSSAGGVPAPLFGGLVSDALPGAEVAVLADASGGYVHDPAITETIGARWGIEAAIPDWAVTRGVDTAGIGIPDLFHLAGRHDPSIRMARYDNAFDATQRRFAALTGLDGEHLPDVLDRNEWIVEERGVDLSVYVAPGEDHTILGSEQLYDLRVAGRPFVDWVADLADGGTPGDVRCTDCGAPSGPG